MNKARKELKEKITMFLVDNFEAMQEEFEKLEGKEKVQFYCALLPYGLAKMKPEPEIILERLTDEEIDEIYEKLKHVAITQLQEPDGET